MIQNIKLTSLSEGRYSAALSTGEIIIVNSARPTAAACQQLLDSGCASTKDLVRVTCGDPTSFVVSLDQFSRYRPSGARIAFERAPFRARHDA